MRTKDLRKNHQTEDRQGLRVSKGAAGGEWSVEVEVVVVFGGAGGGLQKERAWSYLCVGFTEQTNMKRVMNLSVIVFTR